MPITAPWGRFLELSVEMAIGVWAGHDVIAGHWQPDHTKSEWAPSPHGHEGHWGSSAGSGDPDDVVWQEIACDLDVLASKRGKDRWQKRDYPSGNLALSLRDEAGAYTNLLPHDLQISPIRLGNRLRVQMRAVGDTVWRPIFYGYISDTPETAMADGTNRVQVTVLEYLSAFARTTVDTVRQHENVTERLNRLLDADEWPALLRDIDQDDIELEAGDDAGKLAGELRHVARSGGGSLFMTTEGKVAYRLGTWFETGTRTTTLQGFVNAATDDPPAQTVPVLCAGGLITFDKSDARVITRVAVGTRGLDSAAAYRVESPPGIARFGFIDFTDFDLLTHTHHDLKAIGDRILHQNAESRPRVQGVTIPITDVETARWAAEAQIGDLIAVRYRAQAGWEATLQVHIHGIQWRITPEGADLILTTDDYKETP